MTDQSSGRPVLVGVDRLDHVQQLVRTAGDLAQFESGSVRLVTVAVKRSNSPVSVLSDDVIVREFAEASHELLDRAKTPPGVTVDRDIIVARSAARGLLEAVEETDPAAMVVGWAGPTSRARSVFGSTVDTLIERAPCDLYVERVGREADGVDSVLLPVAGGPHVETAVQAAVAIARRNDARILVYAVDVPGEGTASEFANEGMELVRRAGGDGVRVGQAIEAHDDVITAIVEEASAHDVVVLGTTRQGALRRKLAGSVPRRVVDRTDLTVILARNGDVVGGLRHRLGELLRR